MLNRHYKITTISLAGLMLLLSVFSVNFQTKAEKNIAVTPCHQVKTSNCGSSSAKPSIGKYLSLAGSSPCTQGGGLVLSIIMFVAVLASLVWAYPLFKPPKGFVG